MSEPINIDDKGNIILKINWRSTLKILLLIAITIGSYFTPLKGLTPASRICLMIFVGAAGFWVTEVIPPFATALMVIVVSIYTLGETGSVFDLGENGIHESYQIFLNPIASPVLVLFFGGFVLAIAATKHGLDVRLAKAFLKPFGTHPKMVLLGVITITAVFSMFMSNTATTAMMIAIMTPLFSRFEGRDPFKKALVLAVPFAASIGGMGTIIGTPPNAVAASILAEMGHPITFGYWMIFAVPIVVVILFILWFTLLHVFKPRSDHFELLFPETLALTWDLVIVVITFSVTVLLWLSEPLHHIPSAVVALLPVMIFTAFGIIDRNDLKKIDWDVLALVAGGLSLGVAMKASGLSEVLVQQLSFSSFSPVILLIVVVFFSLALSNFMSNTSAANLIIPIITSIAVLSPKMGAVAVAMACSLAMSLPISTPPNAIAFATRAITTRDMARYGTIISIFGLVVAMIFLMLFRQFFNIL